MTQVQSSPAADSAGDTLNAEVIVVGAGPSGLTAAMEVAASGVRVVILEKRGEPALSRAGVIQPRVMEIFAMRGLADTVLARAREVNGDGYKNTRGIWAGLPGINYQLLDSDHPYVVVLSQIEVERILARRCEELGVVVRRNAEVVDVQQDADAVTVTYIEGGVEKEARAQYVIGADGARSVVRKTAGIGWNGHDARNLAVNVDAELPYPYEHNGATVVVNTANGWGLCYPLSEQLTRFAVIDAQTMIGMTRETKITPESAFESLRRVFGTDFGIPPARVSQFHDALFRSETIRVGRILLVGESVRVHYPASGVGMNFCIQDATNLGWKVAAAVQGWGPEGILDSYEIERGHEIDDHLASVQAQTGVQFSFSEDAVALKELLAERLIPIPEVQKTLAEQLSGLSANYGDGTSLEGSRATNVVLADGRGLYDAIQPSSYTLLLPAAATTAFTTSPHVVAVTGELPGAEGDYVIVRPDGYVDAIGDEAAIEARLKELRLS